MDFNDVLKIRRDSCKVFLRRDCKQVADKLRGMSTRIGTLRQHFFQHLKTALPSPPAANTSTSSFSPGTHAYVSAKICPGSTRSRMLRLPHRSSLTIITLPCITTPECDRIPRAINHFFFFHNCVSSAPRQDSISPIPDSPAPRNRGLRLEAAFRRS